MTLLTTSSRPEDFCVSAAAVNRRGQVRLRFAKIKQSRTSAYCLKLLEGIVESFWVPIERLSAKQRLAPYFLATGALSFQIA